MHAREQSVFARSSPSDSVHRGRTPSDGRPADLEDGIVLFGMETPPLSEPLVIGGTEIPRGTRTTVRLPIAPLYTLAAMAMPVHVVRGKRDGPRLFVSAAIHGDEIIGVEIIRRLLGLQLLRQMRGTLIAVPVVNVYGYTARSRYLPDRRDLNRSFPGSASGSMASRLAYTFMEEIVANSTHGIDLHTGAIDRTNLPQVRVSLDIPSRRQDGSSVPSAAHPARQPARRLDAADRPRAWRTCLAVRGRRGASPGRESRPDRAARHRVRDARLGDASEHRADA